MLKIQLLVKEIKRKIITSLLDDYLERVFYHQFREKFSSSSKQKGYFEDKNRMRCCHRFVISTEKFFIELNGNGYAALKEQHPDRKFAVLEQIFFHVGAIEHWCDVMCVGEWGIDHDEREYRFYFHDQGDAMAFKIRWIS